MWPLTGGFKLPWSNDAENEATCSFISHGTFFLSCCVMLCYVMLCYVMLCYVMLCYVMLCYAMLCYAMLCYAMLCYAMLCYVMLCYVMLCYVMLCIEAGPLRGEPLDLAIWVVLQYLIPLCLGTWWAFWLFYRRASLGHFLANSTLPLWGWIRLHGRDPLFGEQYAACHARRTFGRSHCFLDFWQYPRSPTQNCGIPHGGIPHSGIPRGGIPRLCRL